MLGGVTRCRRVFEESIDGELREHFLLHAAEDFGEVDMAGIGSAGHGVRLECSWSCARSRRRETRIV